jgi:hypothetical protein
MAALRHLRFAAVYGAAVGIAFLAGAFWLRGGVTDRLGLAIVLFAAGAACAGWGAAWFLARWGTRRPGSARFAAAAIILTVLTVGFDAFFLFLNYSAYFIQWWPTPFTLHWFFNLITTGGGVTFFFIALGLPLLLPLGLPVLFGAAFILSRPPRLS